MLFVSPAKQERHIGIAFSAVAVGLSTVNKG